MFRAQLAISFTFLMVFTFFLSDSKWKGSDNTIPDKTPKHIRDIPKDQIYWEEVADGMSRSLIRHFWGANFEGYEERYYFNYGSDLSNMTTNHYWPQAHAMDVVVDAYNRTSDQFYLDYFPLWWEGAPKYNFSGREEDPWWNVFVDDMEWIVLAQIRMYESTGKEEYISKAQQMYNDWIWTNWGPEDEAPWNGGITWKTDVAKSKNACSNGPAAIIAAKLYRLYDQLENPGDKSKQSYLEEAIVIYSWLNKNLYDPAQGKVYDNMDGKGFVNKAIYTYNQGTFIGAAHELYNITGDSGYLEDAVKASNYVIDEMSNNKGVLANSNSGDGGLFNGIFFRYFALLVNEENLDLETRKKIHDYITKSAKIMVENGVNQNTMLFSGDWWNAPSGDDPIALTPMLSGCMLAEAMCILKPLDFISD